MAGVHGTMRRSGRESKGKGAAERGLARAPTLRCLNIQIALMCAYTKFVLSYFS